MYSDQNRSLQSLARDIRDAVYEITPLMEKKLSPQEFNRFIELSDKLLLFFDEQEF